MIRFKEFYGQNIKKAQKIALDNRLHLRHSKSNGVAKEWYKESYVFFKNFIIAFDSDKVIGCCCITNYYAISVYVCKEYRRQGIGTKLVKLATKKHKDVDHEMSIKYVREFYNKALT